MSLLNKRISIVIIFLFGFSALSAQKASISGQIIDETNSEPVPFAQVALLQEGSDVPVTGGLTGEKGKFSFAAAPGDYTLRIVFVGYQEKEIPVSVDGEVKKLGTINLSPSTRELEEVVIESDRVRRPVTTDLEGINIRPDQTISNIGGSLLDVLRNTPSVNVSQDGTVSLRGSSSTNVLIDGRNSSLTADLEQIPASAIENIKIVNNPNAKYDAEGAGGVINIQLKKGEDTGTNGKAEFTIGTRYRMNGNLRINHKTKDFNLFGGYSYRSWPSVGYSRSERLTFNDQQRLVQFSNRSRDDSEHTFNFGGDYYFGRNKISYEGAVNFENESDQENNRTTVSSLQDSEVLLRFLRQNKETEDNHTLDNAIIYERLFPDSDREFRAVASHSFRNQLENQDFIAFQWGAQWSGTCCK